MDLTDEDIRNLLRIIDESDYDDVRLEIGDFKLHVRKHDAAEHAPLASPSGNREKARTNAPVAVRAASTMEPPVRSTPRPHRA